MSVGQEAAGTDREVFVIRDRVNAIRVPTINLEAWFDTLLSYEDIESYLKDTGFKWAELGQLYADHG